MSNTHQRDTAQLGKLACVLVSLLALMLLALILGPAQLARAQERLPQTPNGERKSSTTPQPSSSPEAAIRQQQEDEVVRVETNLVTIPATVMDRDGRYITNLKKEDFRIFEDGVEQEIAFFASVEQPFTALLLIDNSGSMRNYMANLARAANAFVKQLRPNDQLIVATFSDSGRIQIILEATKKRDLQQKFLLQARIGDYFTTTFDAVEHGIKYMRNFQGRRAIILFSDGEQYGNKASAKSNLRDAEEQEVLIYTIRFGAFPTHQPGYTGYVSKKDRLKLIEKVNSYMQYLAQKTGGRGFQVEDISNLEETFRMVAEELGQQYSLGYYPKGQLEAGQRRRIRVKVQLPDLVVRARNSLVVDKELAKRK